MHAFKCLVSLSDPFISAEFHQTQAHCQSSKGIRCWIRLGPTPSPLRTVFTVEPQESGILYQPTSGTVAHFNKDLFNYYLHLSIAKSVYDIDTPQTFKSVCIKCHTSRPLNSLLDRMCCWFFIDVVPNSVFAFPFLFLSFLKYVILVSCIKMFFFWTT